MLSMCLDFCSVLQEKNLDSKKATELVGEYVAMKPLQTPKL